MSEFEKGMLVQHASLGLGKVVALEPKAVHVFFVGRDSRFAAKLRLPVAAGLLRPAEAGQQAWLGGVSAFTLDATTGRYGFAESWIPHEEAEARFLQAYPGGFADPLYLGEGRRPSRHAKVRRAHDAYVETLGEGAGERLLAEGAIRKLVDAAVAVEKAASGCLTGADKASLAAGLKEPKAAEAFFGALFAYVGAETPDRAGFEALAAAVDGLPTEAGTPAWPLVTLLPFIARPEAHMLLRPKATSQAAHRLGLELRFAAEPNWTTYSTFLRSSEQLLGRLRSIGARDLVDVDAFLTLVTTRPALRVVSAAKAVVAEAEVDEVDEGVDEREPDADEEAEA
jgi:hypothetical protein